MSERRQRGRRFSRRDANHEEILTALQRAGVQVRDLSHVGDGIPDLLCQHRRTRALLLLEIKRDDDARDELTPAQVKFKAAWPVIVVVDKYEALRACGIEVERC